MDMKKIAASAVSVLLLLFTGFTISQRIPSLDNSLKASADYEFEFVDEDDAENIADAYADEYDDTDYYTQEERTAERQFNPVRSFFISLIIGLLIGLIVVSVMKSSMKSVHKKSGATEYRKQDSFKLSVKTDEHLGTKVEKSPVARAAVPTQNNISRK